MQYRAVTADQLDRGGSGLLSSAPSSDGTLWKVIFIHFVCHTFKMG